MSGEPWTEEQIRQAAVEEWLGVLGRLWTAVGKPIDAERLEVYHRVLRGIPMGLLEIAVERLLRENIYQVVPQPGAIWKAVRRELGDPWDVWVAMEDWCERRWNRLMGRGVTRRPVKQSQAGEEDQPADKTD